MKQIEVVTPEEAKQLKGALVDLSECIRRAAFKLYAYLLHYKRN